MKELTTNWDAWVTNCKKDRITMYKNRSERLQVDIDALQMKYDMVTNSSMAGAEKIMRNVAKRLLMGDTARLVISWKMKIVEIKNRERGEGIMRRVGMRMLNKDLASGYVRWQLGWMEDKNKARGEMIMRRVGARMTKKELTTNWDAWVQNYKENMLEMVR